MRSTVRILHKNSNLIITFRHRGLRLDDGLGSDTRARLKRIIDTYPEFIVSQRTNDHGDDIEIDWRSYLRASEDERLEMNLLLYALGILTPKRNDSLGIYAMTWDPSEYLGPLFENRERNGALDELYFKVPFLGVAYDYLTVIREMSKQDEDLLPEDVDVYKICYERQTRPFPAGCYPRQKV
jgi:hypothetical protein